jgi:hypothetical protein
VLVVLAVPAVDEVPDVDIVPVAAVSVPVIVFVCADVSVSAEIVVVAVVSVCTIAVSVPTVDVIVVSVDSVSLFLQANIDKASSVITTMINNFFIRFLLPDREAAMLIACLSRLEPCEGGMRFVICSRFRCARSRAAHTP